MPSPPSDRALLATELRLAGAPSADRTMDVVASTDALDSHGTVLDQATWKLDRFLANPVVLYAHNQRDLPVGFAENVRVENGALHARLRFVTAAANPLAEQVWQLVQQKALRAVSVGFFAGAAKALKRDGREVTQLVDNELLEISVVPVPSNPEAVAKMRARALSPPEEPMADAKQSQATEADEDPIKNAPKAPAPTVAAASREVEIAALEAKLRDAKSEAAEAVGKRDAAQTELAAARAAQGEAEAARDVVAGQLDLAHGEIAALRARVDAAERKALLAEARAAGKLTPAHLDPATVAGSYLARLSNAEAAAYLNGLGRALPRVDVRPPRPLDAKRWADLRPAERAALYQTDRATYDALKAAAGE